MSEQSRLYSSRFRQDFVGPKAAEGFAARYVVRKPDDMEMLLALLLEAAAGGSTLPSNVPSELLDSDADPCYYEARGRGSAPWPGRGQRGYGRHMWQPPLGGRAWPTYNSQERGRQSAGQPRPPVGQLVRPPGPRPQQRSPQQQPMRPMASSTSAARPGVWQTPTSVSQLNTPNAAGMQQLSISRVLGDQAGLQPAAPAILPAGTHHMQAAEQRGAAGQMPHATSAGRQRPAPPPYRPPGW